LENELTMSNRSVLTLPGPIVDGLKALSKVTEEPLPVWATAVNGSAMESRTRTATYVNFEEFVKSALPRFGVFVMVFSMFPWDLFR